MCTPEARMSHGRAAADAAFRTRPTILRPPPARLPEPGRRFLSSLLGACPAEPSSKQLVRKVGWEGVDRGPNGTHVKKNVQEEGRQPRFQRQGVPGVCLSSVTLSQSPPLCETEFTHW